MKANQQNGNYMRKQKNKLRIREEEKEKSLEKQAVNKMENEAKYGKQKHASLILLGEYDRINGIAPQPFEEESMQKAYSYGYFERGSRVLEGKFATNRFSKEIQMEFGISDCINNIPVDYLKGLTKYPEYAYGRNFQMGKKAYYYITNEGLTFNEYVLTMGLVFPEVQTEAFKEGYYTEQLECKKINKIL